MSAVGKILLMPKGNYSSSATYNILDLVRHNGISWVCKVNGTTGIEPTSLATTNWQVLAQDGDLAGWSSIRNKPFETIGDGLTVNASEELEIDDTVIAPKASPAFTGTPTAPTANAGTNTTQIATTEFVQTRATELQDDIDIKYGTDDTTTTTINDTDYLPISDTQGNKSKASWNTVKTKLSTEFDRKYAKKSVGVTSKVFVPITWNVSEFQGGNIWSDGTNTYLSKNTSHYKLNNDIWEPMTWTGAPTDFNAKMVWSDGTNIYYSYQSTQKKLNGTTWVDTSWTFDTGSVTGFDGSDILTFGNDVIYIIPNAPDSPLGYILQGTTWKNFGRAAGGYTAPMTREYIWTDGTHVYFDHGQDHAELKFRYQDEIYFFGEWQINDYNTPIGTATYTMYVDGSQIWTDGENIYAWDTRYNLLKLTNTFNLDSRVWDRVNSSNNGTSFMGLESYHMIRRQDIWTDGTTIYVSQPDGTGDYIHYKLVDAIKSTPARVI